MNSGNLDAFITSDIDLPSVVDIEYCKLVMMIPFYLSYRYYTTYKILMQVFIYK